jgi:hypothetical protein
VYNFEFDKFECDYDFDEAEREHMTIRPRPLVSDWTYQNLEFRRPGYNSEGPFKLYDWQIEPTNAFLFNPRLLLIGAPQTGKSTAADAILFYSMGELKINGMIAYAEHNTVQTVFKDRIRTMIEENQSLRVMWDGNEDNMTTDRIKLRSCVWRVASAFNKNTLATFSAGVTIGSEVGKWSKVKFQPVSTLEGRQGSYYSNGFLRTVLETSAFEIGDYMYQEVFAAGTLILHPHYPCPHCNHYQEFDDANMRLRNDKHGYAEIMQYKFDAVQYICPNCHKEITERERMIISKKLVWAAPKIDQEDFKQEAETILPDGRVSGVIEHGKRPGIETVCYRWPRNIDTGYKFWQNLAAFFRAKNDPLKLKTYQAEIMSRYTSGKTGSVSINSLEYKKADYVKNVVPDDVLVITAGFDTQDDGWYYTYVGWTFGLKWFVLKHGRVIIPFTDKLMPASLLSEFTKQLTSDKLTWINGDLAEFRLAGMDRGGHRADDVTYLCSRIPNLFSCIGAGRLDITKENIYKSEKHDYYWQQTEYVSDLTGNIIDSDDFYLPSDVSTEFCRQIVRQYFSTRSTEEGTPVRKWIHGGEDHYRDCLNLAYSAGKLLKLDSLLLDPVACETIYNSRNKINAVSVEQKPITDEPKTKRLTDTNHYFRRALR